MQIKENEKNYANNSTVNANKEILNGGMALVELLLICM